MEPSTNTAICYGAKFAVSFVLSKECSIPIEVMDGLKGNSMLRLIRESFRFVPFVLNGYIIATIWCLVNWCASLHHWDSLAPGGECMHRRIDKVL